MTLISAVLHVGAVDLITAHAQTYDAYGSCFVCHSFVHSFLSVVHKNGSTFNCTCVTFQLRLIIETCPLDNFGNAPFLTRH